MTRQKKKGKCHICGYEGKLSFEHVPPEKAFNDSAALLMDLEQWDKFQTSGKKRGTYQQRGFGAYTLCEKCNSNTGAWYASEYVEWVKKGTIHLQEISEVGVYTLFYLPDHHPLRFVLQCFSR
jgi:hypothetical protein